MWCLDPMSNDTYHSVLGVAETATQTEIKAAYRDLLKKIHPDTVSTLSPELRRLAEGATKDLTEAYSVLSDARKRRQYDWELGLGEHRLKSVRPANTPDVPLCPTSTASTSAVTSDSQRRQHVRRHGNRRLRFNNLVVVILAAFAIFAALLLLGTIIMRMVDPAPDSDDSKVFFESTQSTFLNVTSVIAATVAEQDHHA